MSKFIEVTDIDRTKHLVNVNHIEEVRENTIYMAFTFPNAMSQDYIECVESYDEIKKLIQEGA